MAANEFIKNAYVTFCIALDLPQMFLSECSISRRGGLQPDTWTAIVPYTEMAKLGLDGTVVGEVAGFVQLWYENSPYAEEPAADVVLGNVAIVDISPAQFGREPGETQDKIISYHIAISDYRRAWVAPRGGLLLLGTVNQIPDAGGDDGYSTSELMEACLTAMGATATIVADVGESDRPENLRWDGAHAPSELQRLLECSGSVFAPLISGYGQIVTPGTALPPTIPSGRLIRNVVSACVDRRSGIAIITSCPLPKIHSFDDQAGEAAPAWKYVGQDPSDGKWKPLDEMEQMGGDAADSYKHAFDDASQDQHASLKNQIYRCIQLDPEKYPLGRVRLLPIFMAVDLTRNPVTFTHADLLTLQRDGSYAKIDGGLVRAEKIIPDVNVIIFEHPLMKIASGTDTRRLKLTRGEVCIPETALKPTFSVEGWDADHSVREYGVYGVSVSGGHATSIGETTARAYLGGFRPNVSIFNVPDLLNVALNGGTTSDNRNTEAMQDRAKKYGASVLGVTTPAMRVITVKGFLAIELDACVSEVTYDMKSVTTTIICNGWHVTSRTSGPSNDVGGLS